MSYEWRSIFRESALLLALMAFIGVAGGYILESVEEQLILFPVLLFLVPIINGIGGNLGAVLGARISSALHTGQMDSSIKDPELRENMLFMMLMGGIVFLSLAVGVSLSGFTLPLGITPLKIFIIIIGAGFITIVSITLITVATSLWAYHKGLDPDNIVIPVETTACDFIGIISLVFMIWMVII